MDLDLGFFTGQLPLDDLLPPPGSRLDVLIDSKQSLLDAGSDLARLG